MEFCVAIGHRQGAKKSGLVLKKRAQSKEVWRKTLTRLTIHFVAEKSCSSSFCINRALSFNSREIVSRQNYSLRSEHIRYLPSFLNCEG